MRRPTEPGEILIPPYHLQWSRQDKRWIGEGTIAKREDGAWLEMHGHSSGPMIEVHRSDGVIIAHFRPDMSVIVMRCELPDTVTTLLPGMPLSTVIDLTDLVPDPHIAIADVGEFSLGTSQCVWVERDILPMFGEETPWNDWKR